MLLRFLTQNMGGGCLRPLSVASRNNILNNALVPPYQVLGTIWACSIMPAFMAVVAGVVRTVGYDAPMMHNCWIYICIEDVAPCWEYCWLIYGHL